MIFVTVGTHEQQFNRLVEEVDNLIETKVIEEEVIIQSGYSEYIPRNCQSVKLIGYNEMEGLIKRSRIVITHGGPGSIFSALNNRIVPIVVPRNPNFAEHVDEHQIEFCKKMEKDSRILAVYDISELKDKIVNYEKYCELIQAGSKSNIGKYIEELDILCKQLENKNK